MQDPSYDYFDYLRVSEDVPWEIEYAFDLEGLIAEIDHTYGLQNLFDFDLENFDFETFEGYEPSAHDHGAAMPVVDVGIDFINRKLVIYLKE